MDEVEGRRWREVEAILDGALDRPPEERSAFVDGACGADMELRGIVIELLAAGARSRGPLEGSPVAHAAFVDDFDVATVARLVPGYRIERKLGEGGMGVVFEAVQEVSRRAVAVKLIRSGPLAGEREVRAFRREIFSLARLKHPGIATIHDAGRTAQGIPFLIMELVQGRRLDEYVAGLPPVSERAGLDLRFDVYLQIADAIGHAHQRGIIHRDLKPSNVMVLEGDGDETARGGTRVKVLDFGLARIEMEGGERSLRTASGRVLGTPAYMSPEQARGDPDAQDIRTDVYSLGVILYEMLSGRTPHDVSGRPLTEILRIISAEAPRRLRELAPRVPEDVETIVRKAIDPDPARRYPSVAALAEDIERYRANLPILARRPSTLYQIRKIVARHTAAFAFAAVVLVLLAGFGAAMFVLYRAQVRATAVAERQTAKAERTLTFFQEILASADPKFTGGEEITVKELVGRSAAEVDSSFVEDPDVRASIQHTVGLMQGVLGSEDEAAERLHHALQTRELQGDDNAETIATLEGLASIEIRRGRPAEAEELARRALAAAERVYGEGSNDVASLLDVLGGALDAGAKYAAAESTFQRALAIYDALPAPNREDEARLLTNLANVFAGQGKYEESVKALQDAAALLQGLGLEDQPVSLISRFNLAVRLGDLKRFDESVPILRDVLETQTRVFGANHPLTLRTLSALGFHLSGTEGWAAAEAVLADAVSRTRAAMGNEHVSLAVALHAHAYALDQMERFAEAEPLLRESLSVFQRSLGERHPQSATLLHNLGYNLYKQGRRSAALRLLREAQEIRLDVLGESHPHVADSRELIAEVEAAGSGE
ncbi:MAG: tetratricopeptide repeat protein [Candidatus Eiseniibacteriota bacterium]